MTAFSNQLTHVVAGNSAATTASFMVPTIFTAVSSGYITYELIDAENVVYASGNGINYTVTPENESNLITAECTITVPSNIPVTTVGTAYQIRFTLNLPDEDNQEFFIYSSLMVMPPKQVDYGADDIVELAGTTTSMTLVLQDQADTGTVIANGYMNNTAIPALTGIVATGPTALADGYQYQLSVATPAQAASLVPYNIIWDYQVSGQVYHESAQLFLVTPSILDAMKAVLVQVNKSRAHFGFQPVFSEPEILNYLRLGMDYFNGLFNPTMFTMTNATGPIRFFWIQCSCIIALRSQYLMEGEAAFNFSGQSVSLDVDRSQFYEGLASAIDQQIQEPLRSLKANLAKRGLLMGDGNVNPTALTRNAIGTIGISASPVSNLRNSALSGWLIRGGNLN